jgi:hypothetical protein
MAASKRNPMSPKGQARTQLPESVIADLIGSVFSIPFQEAAEEYRRQAAAALAENHPIEAAICHHLAARLCSRSRSIEELIQLLQEWKVLSSWLPVSDRIRTMTRLEKMASQVSFARSLSLNKTDEDQLMQLVMQKPGRPPEARLVAVRAMELHRDGKTWRQIERQLLPHRRSAKNPGRSINREVQFLKAALNRYNVTIE